MKSEGWRQNARKTPAAVLGWWQLAAGCSMIEHDGWWKMESVHIPPSLMKAYIMGTLQPAVPSTESKTSRRQLACDGKCTHFPSDGMRTMVQHAQVNNTLQNFVRFWSSHNFRIELMFKCSTGEQGYLLSSLVDDKAYAIQTLLCHTISRDRTQSSALSIIS